MTQIIIRNNRKKLREETLMLSIMKKCLHGEMQLPFKRVRKSQYLTLLHTDNTLENVVVREILHYK